MNPCSDTYSKEHLKILRLLATEYPSIALAGATLVNLNALSNLPKPFLKEGFGHSKSLRKTLP